MPYTNAQIFVKKPKIILFDLDDTLLPTNTIRELRHSKYIIDLDKSESYCKIAPFKGIFKSLFEISSKIPIGIVTSSPKWYVNQILKKHFGDIKFYPIVTYNNVTELKPNPEPLLLALRLANVKATEATYVGDALEDFLACNTAKVQFVGAAWSLTRSYPSNACIEFENPNDLIKIIL